MYDYEERKQARIDRLNRAAGRADQEVKELFNQAEKMSHRVPLGQPILVGHHSEQKMRKHYDAVWNASGKAVKASERAEELHRRAEAAENNTAISSDDPNAIHKLEEKLKRLVDWQEEMKALNKYYKKHGTCVGAEGIEDDKAREYDEEIETWNYNKPFPAFELTNNNANIRNIKKRIEQLQKLRDTEFKTIEFEGGKVVPNKELNRLQFFFDEKPDQPIREKLHGWGFHYSKYNNHAWQRQLNNNAFYAAKRVLDFYNGYIEEQKQTENMEQKM